MQATKYNKRAGKRTKVVRCYRPVVKPPIYFWKEKGILHFLASPYIFVQAVPNIKWQSLKDWCEVVCK